MKYINTLIQKSCKILNFLNFVKKQRIQKPENEKNCTALKKLFLFKYKTGAVSKYMWKSRLFKHLFSNRTLEGFLLVKT